MPPVRVFIAASSALLLTCCVCLSTAQQPSPTAQTGIFTVVSRTGTEAAQARSIVNDYFRNGKANLTIKATCSDLIDSILLLHPQNVPSSNSAVNIPRCSCNKSTVNSMVSVSTDLHYLLYMFSHVLGLIYQNSNTNHTQQQLDQLDLLEVVFYRLSNQIQRYLQAHSLSSGYTKCIVHQEIEETVTAALRQEGVTIMKIVNVILCHLRKVTISIMDVIVQVTSVTIYNYQLCRSLYYLTC